MNNEMIESTLKWRYATKQFDPTKKISDKDWETLKASLIMSPSSYGLQLWKFAVIQTPELRQKLREFSWGQSQVTDASHYVVLLSRDSVTEADIQKYIDLTASVRSIPKESLDAYKNLMKNNLLNREDAHSWTQKQTYIAMGFLLETAAFLKIDATPMEGISPADYDKILGLEGSGWKTAATVALGYRHAEDKYQHAPKVRYSEKDLIQTF